MCCRLHGQQHPWHLRGLCSLNSTSLLSSVMAISKGLRGPQQALSQHSLSSNASKLEPRRPSPWEES